LTQGFRGRCLDGNGAERTVGLDAHADVLAYATPTYYGMLVAEVQTAE
jgi:hypothetical protein